MPPMRFLASFLLAGSLLLAGPLGAFAWEDLPESWKVLDASSLWVHHEGRWMRFRIAWIDAPQGNANRQMTERIPRDISYIDLRKKWHSWVQMVEAFSEPSSKALDEILASSKKLKWEEVPEAEPARRSDAKRATVWVRLKVGGDDVAEEMLERGWAIPWVAQGVPQPKQWEDLEKLRLKAMRDCRGMWKELLIECR
ncbi:MAG: thermonuclease family protein [Bdellovibrionota bacterium]